MGRVPVAITAASILAAATFRGAAGDAGAAYYQRACMLLIVGIVWWAWDTIQGLKAAAARGGGGGDTNGGGDPATKGLPTMELPDGRTIFIRNKGEATFLYREIFAEDLYLQHGVTLGPPARPPPVDTGGARANGAGGDGASDGDESARVPVVVDVGANIGMFSLLAHQKTRGRVVIHAFEPVPAVHRVLRANLAQAAADGGGGAARVTAHNVGLSDTAGEVTFQWHPNFSLHSTADAAFDARRAQQLRDDLTHMVRAETKAKRLPWVIRALPERVAVWLAGLFLNAVTKAETITCEMRTLSDVLRDEGVARVDLLKVDVEGLELQVLRGVRAGDWPKIRQVAMEVEDFATCREVVALLEQQGFAVTSEATWVEKDRQRAARGDAPKPKAGDVSNSEVSNIWAVRK